MYIRPLFTLRRTGMERGDCTAPYKVEFLNIQHPTLKEFVKYVLENGKEWGTIYITTDPERTTVWALIGHSSDIPKIDYRYEYIQRAEEYAKILEKYGDKRIKYATSDGGWNKMDYVLLLEGEMKYKAFDNVDIPTDFEVLLKTAKSDIQRLQTDNVLLKDEFDIIMSILDDSESRALSRVRKLTNGDTY